MKISNFVSLPPTGAGFYTIKHATVDVTTGMWIFKKTVTHRVSLKNLNWFFTDTGEFTPGVRVEKLARSNEAKVGG